jgi:predicted Na+-dependent transporter
MKIKSQILAALVVIAAVAPLQAEAKGCIKGAIVGGIAGHMAGHGKMGAVAGCVIGHHEANKPHPEGPSANPPK